MKVYHYTSFSKIGGILGKHRSRDTGLQPRRKVGMDLPSPDYPRAVFALLEPTPNNWVENKDFPDTWNVLVHDLQLMNEGAVLLEIDIDEKDQAFVGERAHLEGFLTEDKTSISDKFAHQDSRVAEGEFIKSQIPLRDYVEKVRAGKLQYSLPEVVIFNTVPPERISVSSQQPLLEQELRSLRDDDRENLARLITKGYAQKELKPWRDAYEAKNGLFEPSSENSEARSK